MDPQTGLDPSSGDDGLNPSANPPAGAANPNPTGNDKPQAGKSIASLEDALAVIKELRDENAKRREREKGKDSRITELETANKTQAERDADELKRLRALDATWRTREAELNRKSAIALAVAEANSVDPKVLSLLLSQRDLEVDDTGTPTEASLSTAITEILAEKSYLVKQAPAAPAPDPKAPASAGASTNPARPHTPTITKATIEKMTPQEIVAAYESGEIPKAMEAGLLGELYTP